MFNFGLCNNRTEKQGCGDMGYKDCCRLEVCPIWSWGGQNVEYVRRNSSFSVGEGTARPTQDADFPELLMSKGAFSREQ